MIARLFAWFRGRSPLEELDDDICDHIERETENNIARGMSADAARRQALVSFGNIALVKEDTRAVRGWVWAEQCLQDCRYALRMLRRNPRFASVVVLTLAVAIGMNTAIFSVFNAVVVRPLGYPHPERLVWLSTVGMDGESGMVTGPDFVDWRERAQSFDRMVAYWTADVTLASAKDATRVRAAMVTEDFWDLSGAAPVAGRMPRAGERDVVLLSQGFAQRWFPGEPDVVGRTVTLNARQVTVVGILPEHFRFHLPGASPGGLRPRDIDIYEPLFVSSARRDSAVKVPVALGQKNSVVSPWRFGSAMATPFAPTTKSPKRRGSWAARASLPLKASSSGRPRVIPPAPRRNRRRVTFSGVVFIEQSRPKTHQKCVTVRTSKQIADLIAQEPLQLLIDPDRRRRIRRGTGDFGDHSAVPAIHAHVKRTGSVVFLEVEVVTAGQQGLCEQLERCRRREGPAESSLEAQLFLADRRQDVLRPVERGVGRVGESPNIL